jgi:hypothetical protein
VPFAAVGAEDSFDIVLDGDEVIKLPFGIGESSRARMQNMPKARAEDTRVTEVGQCRLTVSGPVLNGPMFSALEAKV